MVKLLVAWSSPLISSVHSCCHSSLLQLRPRQSCVSTHVKELSRTSSRAAPFQHSDVSLTSKATHYIRRSSVRICINFDKNNNEIVFRSVCLKIFALWSSVLAVYMNIGFWQISISSRTCFFLDCEKRLRSIPSQDFAITVDQLSTSFMVFINHCCSESRLINKYATGW